MLETVISYVLTTIVAIGYLTMLLGWRVPLLSRSAMLLNYIGFAICGTTIVYTGLDRSTMGAVVLSLSLQNSFFVNVLSRKSSVTAKKAV